jgi:ribonuclease VapC
LELCIVADGYRNPAIRTRLDQILENPVIVIEPVTAEQAQIARQAYRDYGKGSGHPANLNYGDCFSYALARAKREPILFKGDDFIHTDLRNAVTK